MARFCVRRGRFAICMSAILAMAAAALRGCAVEQPRRGVSQSPEWTLRRATALDRDFLFDLNCRTMQAYVEAVWGWDDEFQARFFDKHFDPDGDREIIQIEGRDVGMVEVWERAAEVVLASIRVLPEWQRRGIGTAVIRWLLAESARSGKPVALRVLKVNRRAARPAEPSKRTPRAD